MITGLKAVEIQGRRLEYYDIGAGPALVMMHGGLCSAQDFAKILPHLGTRYRCILPDLLTCDEKNAPQPWDVWLLLDRLGIGRTAILGHSQGGNFAHDMYRLSPERVWAWVNIDCAATGAKIRSFKLRAGRYAPEMLRELQRRKAARPEGPPYEWEPYLSDEGREVMRLNLERQQQRAQGRPLTEPGRTAPPATAIPWRPAPEPIAKKGKYIRCPLLQLNSGRGRLRQENIRPRWVQRYINATDVEYVVFTNSGHWIWLDQTEEFLRTVQTFLQRHMPACDEPARESRGS